MSVITRDIDQDGAVSTARGEPRDDRRPHRRLRRWVACVGVIAVVAGIGVWMLENPPTDDIAVAAPAPDELSQFAEERIYFGHQSVGWNIIGGLDALYAETSTSPQVLETTTPPGGGAFLAHSAVGVNGDPFGKLDEFAAVVDGPLGAELDVAILKFCYIDVTASTDVQTLFSAYAARMAELERAHPEITFIYTTVPLTTDRSWKAQIKAMLGRDDQAGPADNVTRQAYNELVRARYGASGRLFDIAAIQATMAANPTLRDHTGQPYYVLNRAFAADNGHLNALGSRAAAGDLVRVVAGATR